jgi:hypothetical protein
LGTVDDVTVTMGAFQYRPEDNTVVVNFPSGLAPGLHRARVGAPLADLAGNTMPRDTVWNFVVLGSLDTDQDGVPDTAEILLGLNPNNPDSDGDGILDGDEDPDGDGLPTRWELAFGYDPTRGDSDSNGTSDALEDPDRDTLNNLREFQLSTNPRSADSDGDGWRDEMEILTGSNPNNALSLPVFKTVAGPPVKVIAPALGSPGGLPPGTVVAQPPVKVIAPALGDADGLPINTVIAQPPVEVRFP